MFGGKGGGVLRDPGFWGEWRDWGEKEGRGVLRDPGAVAHAVVRYRASRRTRCNCHREGSELGSCSC